jgi:hypothetical protein
MRMVGIGDASANKGWNLVGFGLRACSRQNQARVSNVGLSTGLAQAGNPVRCGEHPVCRIQQIMTGKACDWSDAAHQGRPLAKPHLIGW